MSFNWDPRNFLVKVHDPFSGKEVEPSYVKFSEWVSRFDKDKRLEVAKGAREYIGNVSRATPDFKLDRFVAQSTTWTVLQEGWRNPAAMVTHAMAIDMVAEGRMSWKTAVAMMPMSKANQKGRPSVQFEADALDRHLFGKDPLSQMDRQSADELAEREFAVIREWVKRMKIYVDDKASQNDKEKQLLAQIEKRMFALYSGQST